MVGCEAWPLSKPLQKKIDATKLLMGIKESNTNLRNDKASTFKNDTKKLIKLDRSEIKYVIARHFSHEMRRDWTVLGLLEY